MIINCAYKSVLLSLILVCASGSLRANELADGYDAFSHAAEPIEAAEEVDFATSAGTEDLPTNSDAESIRDDTEDGLPTPEYQTNACGEPVYPEEESVGVAAAESAREPMVSNKTWRRAALITAGVAVAALAIYAVNQSQGKEVFK